MAPDGMMVHNLPTMDFSPLPPVPRPRPWLTVLFAAVLTLLAGLPLGIFPLARASFAPAAPPDGHISLAALREATLDVPPWPADNVQGPSGSLRFHDGAVPVDPHPVADGRPPYGDAVLILSVTYGDVDHDGADETIVLFGCMIEGGSKQLVAYDRDRAGHIVSLGQVVATTGQIRDLRTDGAKVGPDGVVTAVVGDYQRCCADRTPQIWQTRGYALRDGRFTQVSGERQLPLNPHVTQMQVSAGQLVLGAPRGGYRTGTLDVTVSHVRGAHPSRVTILFYAPEGLERAGNKWPSVKAQADSFSVTEAAPAVGGNVTYRFAFRRKAAVTGGEMTIDLATVPWMSQAVPWSSAVTVPIRTGK
ncbi:hypothetical protein Acy02nite_03040 [Actinoplanes cyaneus]|uniref:Uncharacterized protein n=2 Tax=Actinoplanes cyaneus TaxID=52696 RepID=A0A919M2R7_9ACTN|nr:hypothetical protein Acy02nite_03040 [Actinoplanes cyaneus]